MGDINTPEYGVWEEGYSSGFDNAIRLLQIAKKFEDSGLDPEDILEDKLKEIKDGQGGKYDIK